MEQENADKKVPQKKTQNAGWFTSWALGVLSFFFVLMIFERFNPPSWGKLEGTITMVDENGDALPNRLRTVTVFSHYAPGPFRSETGRKYEIWIDDSGNFSSLIPKYPATLFFHTENGRYAAVVDLAKGEPTTGLEVTIRPRHSVTGRLVDRTGAPLANYDFRLEFLRFSEANFNRRVMLERFESLYSRTDANGFFTVDRLIPGLEYQLRTLFPLMPGEGGGFSSVTLPILQPEQYQEPFDLGDVRVIVKVVNPFVCFVPLCEKFLDARFMFPQKRNRFEQSLVFQHCEMFTC
jgi:hypothetical protein